MKLKNKILLAAAGLLVVSGSAAATGTFAWFTANTLAYAQLNAFAVTSGQEDLKVKVYATDNDIVNTMTSTAEAGASLTLSDTVSGKKITDVSYSASATTSSTMVRGDVNKANTILNAAPYVVKNSTPVNDSASTIYYHEFCLEFSTENEAVKTGVFLAKETTFTKTSSTSSDPDMSGAYRVAIFSAVTGYYHSQTKVINDTQAANAEANGVTDTVTTVKKAGSMLAYYAPKRAIAPYAAGTQDVEQALYLPAGATAGTLSEKYANFNGNINGDANGYVRYLGSDNYTGNNTDADFENAVSATNKVYGYLGVAGASASAPLDVVVRIWIEGSDSLAVTANMDTNGSPVTAALKFIGVNVSDKLS